MFSKSCKYAIRSVLFLAIYTSEQRKLGVDDLALKLCVPRHFLAKILQQLTRQGLISSAKGRNGGFYLSKENRKSNLMTIIESMDGPQALHECVLGMAECSNEEPCLYHHIVREFYDQFLFLAKEESIEDSAERIILNNLKIR